MLSSLVDTFLTPIGTSKKASVTPLTGSENVMFTLFSAFGPSV